MSQMSGGEAGQAPEPAGGKAKKPFYKRWWVWAIAGVVVIIIAAGAAGGGNSSKTSASGAGSASPTTTSPTSAAQKTPAATSSAPPTTAAATSAAPPAPSPSRTVTGKATTLGAGTFTGGSDVAAGLYDVTAGPGESGNFVVQGGSTMYNEILGGDMGVSKVRVQIDKGDQIQISGLSQVSFTPVTTALVTAHTAVTLYAGTWTVGQDVGPGRYVATPGAGESGNFVITDEGVNEILGGSSDVGGVPKVTFNVNNGDVIEVSGLSQVKLTPS